MGSNRYRLVLAWLVAISMHGLFGQSLLFPTDYFFDVQRQAAILRDTETVVHTSMQPYLYKTVVPDTLKRMKYDADGFFDKLFYENLVQVRHIDRSSGYDRTFNLDINPILNLSFGRDMKDNAGRTVQYNGRGFWLKIQLGRRLWVESAFIENQAFVQGYLYWYGQASGVMPGQGRWKKFKNTGYDYASSYGIMNIRAARHLQIRLGHGKQKVGHGYRSLLLSDNAFNYPYLQFIAGLFKGRLQYSQTYAILMNLTPGTARTPPNTEPVFQKKPASFQHLSWHTGRYFDIYFFQGTVWRAADSNNVIKPDLFFVNPVIFTNIARFGFNDMNHIIAGAGCELRPFKMLCIYLQGMYDGVHTDAVSGKEETNWGWQAGIRQYDAFGARNLFLQCEMNAVKGASYYSFRSGYQHYAHYNQLLTTPALLPYEIVALAGYSVKRAFIQLKQNIGFDESGSASNFFDARIGYIINPHYNLTLAAGASIRSYLHSRVGANAEESHYIYLSLRTSLFNTYFDF